jgi:hypothetical protein
MSCVEISGVSDQAKKSKIFEGINKNRTHKECDFRNALKRFETLEESKFDSR